MIQKLKSSESGSVREKRCSQIKTIKWRSKSSSRLKPFLEKCEQPMKHQVQGLSTSKWRQPTLGKRCKSERKCSETPRGRCWLLAVDSLGFWHLFSVLEPKNTIPDLPALCGGKSWFTEEGDELNSKLNDGKLCPQCFKSWKTKKQKHQYLSPALPLYILQVVLWISVFEITENEHKLACTAGGFVIGLSAPECYFWSAQAPVGLQSIYF